MEIKPELKDEILEIIDSKDMREYCKQISAPWTAEKYVDLISGAPMGERAGRNLTGTEMNC